MAPRFLNSVGRRQKEDARQCELCDAVEYATGQQRPIVEQIRARGSSKDRPIKEQNSPREIINAWIARAERRGTNLLGHAHCIDERSIAVALSDISYDGCCFITEEALEPGEPLLVEVTGLGQVEGEVRWVDGSRVGILFTSGRHVPVPTKLRAIRRRGRK